MRSQNAIAAQAITQKLPLRRTCACLLTIVVLRRFALMQLDLLCKYQQYILPKFVKRKAAYPHAD